MAFEQFDGGVERWGAQIAHHVGFDSNLDIGHRFHPWVNQGVD